MARRCGTIIYQLQFYWGPGHSQAVQTRSARCDGGTDPEYLPVTRRFSN